MSELKKKTILITAIAAAFKANQNTDKLLVTPDGNCFLPENKSYANAHATRNKFAIKEVIKSEFEADNEAILKEIEADEQAAKEAAEKEAAEKAASEEQPVIDTEAKATKKGSKK